MACRAATAVLHELRSALTAAGLDVEHQQKHRRHQHEHQAGDEAEIVGFHCKCLQPGDRITAVPAGSGLFIARSGFGVARAIRLGFRRLHRPGRGAGRQGAGLGGRNLGLRIAEPHLGPRQYE